MTLLLLAASLVCAAASAADKTAPAGPQAAAPPIVAPVSVVTAPLSPAIGWDPAAAPASPLPNAAPSPEQMPAASAAPGPAQATALGSLRTAGDALVGGADAAAVSNDLFVGPLTRAEPGTPPSAEAGTETQRSMARVDAAVRSLWSRRPDARPVQAPPSADAVLADDVAFFFVPHHDREQPKIPSAVRAAPRGFVHIWGPHGVIRASTVDGGHRDYQIRYTGTSNIHDVYLPPDVTRFTVYEAVGRDPAGADHFVITAKDVAVARLSPTGDVSRGGPWLDWIDLHLREKARVPGRATLFRFLATLFRLDWPSAFPDDPQLDGLPRGARPADSAIRAIIERLATRWDALDLDRVHGPLDYWLVMAATAHTQSPASLWRAERVLAGLKRPRTALYLVKMLALHLRATPGHPIELFGEPGRARAGFVDAAMLVDLLPGVIQDFLERLQDAGQSAPPGAVSERAFALWTIATALEPRLYLADMGQRRFGRRYSYHEELLDRLRALGSGERMLLLLAEIQQQRSWYPFRHPSLAFSGQQAIQGYLGTSSINKALEDPRPIRTLAFASPDKSYRSDPILANTRWSHEADRGLYYDWITGRNETFDAAVRSYRAALVSYRDFFQARR